ncbi:MAG TPA: glycosyltransferase family 1 protein [Dongiaceae bacterium]|jgi:glycosyltransferase involved in cell wall biosynthesis
MSQSGKLILDMSNLARWLGRPTGIVRREQALVRHALAGRRDIRFCVLDESRQAFRTVRPEWVEPLSRGTVALDFDSAAFRRKRNGWRKILPSRFLLLYALERRRLTSGSQAERQILAALQRLLYWPRALPARFMARDGTSHRALAMDLVLAAPEPLTAQDTILSVGNYNVGDVDIIADLKRRHGFRYVSMCHDLIALQFPEFFTDSMAGSFRRHWTAILPLAERILVNSRAVEADIRAFCRGLGREPGEIVLVRPGCDLSGVEAARDLPAGLAKGRYVLFVGTIEPRKGHAMILDVWRRLLEKGVPQRHGFTLVLVGQRGWKVDDLIRRLDDPVFAGSLLHLSATDDATLAGLYRDAAFCLLPSHYEGFGMPVIEAFARGKAIIASTAGALPEVVGGLSPCLPPDDSAAWLAMLEQWIEDERARAPYEAAIGETFRPVTWDSAATEIFDAALEIQP